MSVRSTITLRSLWKSLGNVIADGTSCALGAAVGTVWLPPKGTGAALSVSVEVWYEIQAFGSLGPRWSYRQIPPYRSTRNKKPPPLELRRPYHVVMADETRGECCPWHRCQVLLLPEPGGAESREMPVDWFWCVSNQALATEHALLVDVYIVVK